jgi:mycofactocin system FadH/OYE family oxidoreductase 2
MDVSDIFPFPGYDTLPNTLIQAAQRHYQRYGRHQPLLVLLPGACSGKRYTCYNTCMTNKLFLPLRIGQREMRNRIIFGSHTTNFAERNLLSSRHADYYASRAAGGAGAIVLEEHIVHASDLPYERALLGYLPGTGQAIVGVSARIHAHGSLVLVQLNHNGQQGISDLRQQELWAPSAVAGVSSREVPKVMEQADIDAVVTGFAEVARTVTRAGADGVELNISDSSLLRQFLSPLTNFRSDEYGGPLENRLRFVQQTLEAVDAILEPDKLLGIRLCADELAPWGGLTPEQSSGIARLLTASGRIDYITVSMGSIFSAQMFPFHASMHVPPAYAAHLAAAIKAEVAVPVFAAGRIMTAARAERILLEEQADGVELIRALIADPQLPRLSQAGQANEVRPCISCNQGCQVRTVMNVALACAVNPAVLQPPQPLPQRRAKSGGQVLIIGAGPAGMEAARTAALHGRQVALYEREATAGGAVALAARGPGRAELQLIIDYLQAQLQKLGISFHMGVEVTPEMILAQEVDSVVIATGAEPGQGLLPIAGHELPHVTNIRRILRGEPIEGQKVVIIDETSSHGVLSVAELLLERGHSVEILSEDWYVGRDLVATHDLVAWMQRVLAAGLVMTPHTTIARIEPGQVVVADRFVAGERAVAADVVVLGAYERPAQALYYALKGRVPRLYRAGDCIAPRRIEQAILEGRLTGASL